MSLIVDWPSAALTVGPGSADLLFMRDVLEGVAMGALDALQVEIERIAYHLRPRGRHGGPSRSRPKPTGDGEPYPWIVGILAASTTPDLWLAVSGVHAGLPCVRLDALVQVGDSPPIPAYLFAERRLLLYLATGNRRFLPRHLDGRRGHPPVSDLVVNLDGVAEDE